MKQTFYTLTCILKDFFPRNILATFDFLFAFFKAFQQFVPSLWKTWNRTEVNLFCFVCISDSTYGFISGHHAAVLFVNPWI